MARVCCDCRFASKVRSRLVAPILVVGVALGGGACARDDRSVGGSDGVANGGIGSGTGGNAGDKGGNGVGGDAGGGNGEGGTGVGGVASGAGGVGAGGISSGGAGAGGAGTGGAGGVGSGGKSGGGAGGSPPTCDLEGFADRVRTVRTQGGTRNSCASPLPNDPVVGQEEALEAIVRFLSEVVGNPPDSFEYLEQECGDPMHATCASRFQHDLYKSNGTLGDLLYPLAQELEACATNVSETIWTSTVDGTTGAAIVCLSGTWNGELRGIAFFNNETGCP